jgi:hypothetical protein
MPDSKFRIVFTIVLILYICNVDITMPIHIRPIYENMVFRFVYLLGLAYVSRFDMLLALLMGMAYILTRQMLTEKSIVEGFIEGYMDVE